MPTVPYDGLNRMTQVVQQAQGGGSAVLPKRVDLTCNAAGAYFQRDVLLWQSAAFPQPVRLTAARPDALGPKFG